MIKSLQSLRAIGALMIFVHHFANDNHLDGTVFQAFGDGPVTWFFMLSGFVMSIAYGESARDRSVSGHCVGMRAVAGLMISRFRRLAPLYYIGMLLMYVLLVVTHSWVIYKALLASVLMVQSWVPDMYYFFSYDRPAWFVSDIMFCYLLFLPMQWVIERYRYGWAYLLVPVMAVYFAVAMIFGNTDNPTFNLYIIYVVPPMRIPAFLLGMLLWRVVGRMRGISLSARAGNLLLGVTALVMTGWFVMAGNVAGCFSMSSYWWPATALMLVALALTDSVDCVATRLLHLPALVSLGNASMAFYLLHRPWLSYTSWLLGSFGVELPTAVYLPVSLLMMVGISLWVHRRFYPGRI